MAVVPPWLIKPIWSAVRGLKENGILRYTANSEVFFAGHFFANIIELFCRD